RTGLSARRRAGHSDDFCNFEQDAGAAAAFARAMGDLTRPIAQAVAAKVDFSGATRVVDIGGGHGHLVAAILAAHPHMRGILFDLPNTIASASTHLADAGIDDRCELAAGDFFAAVPTGADAYLLKSILHDWDDTRCAAILGRCGRAMTASNARLH